MCAQATAAIVGLLSSGDRVILTDDVYGGTSRFFRHVAARAGIAADFVDFNAPGALAAAITPATKMLWIETPTNPLLKLIDIRAARQCPL